MALGEKAHAAQGHVKMCLSVHAERSHESAIVLPWSRFVFNDEVLSFFLWQTANCGSGMQAFEQGSQFFRGGKRKGEIASQVNQVACPDGMRGLLYDIVRELFQPFGQIISYQALLGSVLFAPYRLLSAVAYGLVEAHLLLCGKLHGTGQRHGVPCIAIAAEQRFGRGHKPCSALFC